MDSAVAVKPRIPGAYVAVIGFQWVGVTGEGQANERGSSN